MTTSRWVGLYGLPTGIISLLTTIMDLCYNIHAGGCVTGNAAAGEDCGGSSTSLVAGGGRNGPSPTVEGRSV